MVVTVVLLVGGGRGLLAIDAAAAGPAQDPSTETTVVDPSAEPVPSTTDAPRTGAGSRRVADENRKIWVVVAGLVAVAVALAWLTIRYWRHTRPVRQPVHSTDGAATTETLAPTLELSPAPGRELEPTPTSTNGRGDDQPAGNGDGSGRHSRRAVAGADHVTVDEAWEPRGTGEYERIVVPAADRSPRPNRSQRAAAYEAGGRSS